MIQDERHRELELASTRVQERGPITDYIGAGAPMRGTRLAVCRCIHGTEWPEGGMGCEACTAEAHSRAVADHGL